MPVWRPAFQAVPAAYALELHVEAGAALAGWGWDARGPEGRGAGLETGVPSRHANTPSGSSGPYRGSIVGGMPPEPPPRWRSKKSVMRR